MKPTFTSLGGSPDENCGIIVIQWKDVNDWTCIAPPEHTIQCACEKQGPVYLKLRGRCPDSVIDTYWTPQTEGGQYILHGIQTSEIRYDPASITWKLKAVGKGVGWLSASSDAAFHSFLLGKSNWQITDDKSGPLIY